MARIEIDVDLDGLAHELAYAIDERSLLIFVMSIDSNLADLVFTKKLRDQLNEVIEQEES